MKPNYLGQRDKPYLDEHNRLKGYENSKIAEIFSGYSNASTAYFVPLHDKNSRTAVMIFLFSGNMKNNLHDSEESGWLKNRHTLHLLSIHLNEAIERLLTRRNEQLINLTAREAECLKWTARGKSSWQISQILSLSERTVNFHLSNAMQKLSTQNRTHAVAKALYQGLINI
ncbi:MAG TPA: helix-turn-helix transcriptional regulator [Alphaproteobacteria bacterium]|nr:helix-turn-helix transcriptional regulator [Alphaproteobacteria bacterium]